LGTSCRWVNSKQDEAITINSDEELLNYIDCGVLRGFPSVDFEKYSLLVLNVKYCNIDSEVKRLLLQQLSADSYEFSIDVVPSLTANAAPLIVAIIVEKLNGHGTIEPDIMMIKN
jgi:hypothetical protein